MLITVLVPLALAGEPADTWAQPTASLRDTAEAERVFRTGDIDNLGYGWPDGFDPFAGEYTPTHGYPWQPEADDPDGTDRIMVGSRWTDAGGDGYTSSTQRPDNLPRTLVIATDLGGATPSRVWLQIFADDFQSPTYSSRYRVWLDGQRVPRIERLVNTLEQGGPIGRLVTFPLLAEEFALLADGRLEVCIDDPETGAADGFAVDFARVLVNPREGGPRGVVTGRVVDANTGNPLSGALVEAGGVSTTTGADGAFRLAGVVPGLVAVSASRAGFAQAVEASDLVGGGEVSLELQLPPEEAAIADELSRYGRVTLRGITFASGSDQIQASAEPTLAALVEALRATTDRVEVHGHTDSDGSEAYNLDLSKRRAAAVVAWLVARGIEPQRIEAKGFGEARPTADNGNEQGKGLNRRVEIVVGSAIAGGGTAGTSTSDGPTCRPAAR